MYWAHRFKFRGDFAILKRGELCKYDCSDGIVVCNRAAGRFLREPNSLSIAAQHDYALVDPCQLSRDLRAVQPHLVPILAGHLSTAIVCSPTPRLPAILPHFFPPTPPAAAGQPPTQHPFLKKVQGWIKGVIPRPIPLHVGLTVLYSEL